MISPVVGRIGVRGPEFCREADVAPPPWGPDDFFIGSPCLLSGPELVFFKDPVVRWPECEAGPPNEVALDGPLVMGPDFRGLDPSVGISNIFPNSPDFFILPPVYGIATELIVGGRSFGCSGLPET